MAQPKKDVSVLRLVPAPSPERTGSAAALSEAELLAAARAGNEQVAAALHDRVRPTVDATLVRLLGRRDADHDDLAQRALIELFTTLNRYRGECSLDGWVSTLTARVVYKDLRHRRVERRAFPGADVDDRDGPDPAGPVDLGRQISMRDLLARVHHILANMDQDRAWAFLLHEVCGYDLREIASILHISVAAAQTRLFRGRREVHARLAADPELAGLLQELCGGSL
jgi:RNA polymerase sigma-70 factor (ECF subfamily)